MKISDKMNLTVGIRYSDDERIWDGTLVQSPFGAPGFSENATVEDSQVSGDISLNYRMSEETNLYGRLAKRLSCTKYPRP